MSSENQDGPKPTSKRTPSYCVNGGNGIPAPPASVAFDNDTGSSKDGNAVLELADGSVFQGFSFGGPGKSVAGECVFQTGALLFGNFPG